MNNNDELNEWMERLCVPETRDGFHEYNDETGHYLVQLIESRPVKIWALLSDKIPLGDGMLILEQAVSMVGKVSGYFVQCRKSTVQNSGFSQDIRTYFNDLDHSKTYAAIWMTRLQIQRRIK